MVLSLVDAHHPTYPPQVKIAGMTLLLYGILFPILGLLYLHDLKSADILLTIDPSTILGYSWPTHPLQSRHVQFTYTPLTNDMTQQYGRSMPQSTMEVEPLPTPPSPNPDLHHPMPCLTCPLIFEEVSSSHKTLIHDPLNPDTLPSHDPRRSDFQEGTLPWDTQPWKPPWRS